jgi:alkaline phosphatase
MSGLKRRDLFKASLLLPVAGVGCARKVSGAKTPKNIVFMVADGMSPGVLPMAEIFSKTVRQRGTMWAELLSGSAAANGMFDQASLDSCVTDSAAASSSWGSGVRICNGAINMLPGGRALTPIATIAQEQGRRVGLVTTTTLTHATPAGFAAVHETRSADAEIAVQYVENVDVLMGGGIESFTGEERKDGRDVVGEYQAAGFQYVSDCAGLEGTRDARKLLGIFSRGQLPYNIDRRQSGDQSTPNLATCTKAALDLLDNKEGFLLQVEGGRVDHAAHASDAAAMLWEQLDFDDAVRVAVEYANRRGDTLVVLCSDHGNSNPGMNGIAKGFRGDYENFLRLAAAKRSFGVLQKNLKRTIESGTAGSVAERVASAIWESHAVLVSAREASVIASAVAGQKDLTLNKQFDSVNGVLGQTLCNHLGVGWSGKGHTTDYTISTAIGPGAGEFAGLVRNTQVFEIMTGFMGSQFRNPSMSEDQAQSLLSRNSAPEEIHWV